MVILSYFQTLPVTMTSSHFTSLDLGLLIYKMLMFKSATHQNLSIPYICIACFCILLYSLDLQCTLLRVAQPELWSHLTDKDAQTQVNLGLLTPSQCSLLYTKILLSASLFISILSQITICTYWFSFYFSFQFVEAVRNQKWIQFGPQLVKCRK